MVLKKPLKVDLGSEKMRRIAINGINSKVGGGKSILLNYMRLLDQQKLDDGYFLLTTKGEEFDWLGNNNIAVVKLPSYYANTFFSPVVYEILINSYLKKQTIDLVFNLGDLVINTEIPQIYLFDWPYAIYPQSIVWKWMDWKDWFIRKLKLHFIRRRLHLPAVTIAQTPLAKMSLENLYGLSNVEIVPNAVALNNLAAESGRKFTLPPGRKLLYLTHYYVHKNLEIFIPLAERIKEVACNYRIILTISGKQHMKATKLLRNIRDHGLDDIIVNLGPIDMADVPSLYKQCDALVMPTLLESFSGTYVEAMYHEIPIFTSDLDFAKVICGEAACYFDPHDPDDILRKLDYVFEDTYRMKALTSAGREVLSNYADWPQVFSRYQGFLHSELKSTPLNA